jgi:hypothetical protein
VSRAGSRVNAASWSRRRLLLVLAAVVAAAAVLLASLVYALWLALAPTGTGDAPASTSPGRRSDQAADRDWIAAEPMLRVSPADSQPTTPAAVAAPTIQVPPSTRTGPISVPSGFPHTPRGAVGQLAAIELAVLQGMSIPLANRVHAGWARPGGVGAAEWEMTRNVQAFLSAAGMGRQKDLTTAVVATPAAAQVKGVDGADWVLACVLLEVRAVISVDAQMGYGYCERMQWQQDRWMIAPGAPPVRAPSTWPGSELSSRAGWRTWVDGGDG